MIVYITGEHKYFRLMICVKNLSRQIKYKKYINVNWYVFLNLLQIV